MKHPCRFFLPSTKWGAGWLLPLCLVTTAAAAEGSSFAKEISRPGHLLASGIEIAGIGVITLGVVLTSLVFLVDAFVHREIKDAYHRLRNNLGRAILLGLEFLVAADIIGTVAVDPTMENLGVLAIIVLIRTFLSFSLSVEIEGRWPWQRDSGVQSR